MKEVELIAKILLLCHESKIPDNEIIEILQAIAVSVKAYHKINNEDDEGVYPKC